MARLRVGDIEIDGDNISIGGVPQVPVRAVPGSGAPALPGGSAPASTALVPAARGELVPAASAGGAGEREGLASFPIADRVLFGGGLALAAAGGTILALTAVGAAAMLVFTGLGAMALGVLKRRAVSQQATARASAAERELTTHADVLRPLLADSKPDQTVEWIAARSKLPAATVIRTLAFMRARGDVVEELNTDTGEWYYAGVLALPGSALTLDERLALIDRAERKP